MPGPAASAGSAGHRLLLVRRNTIPCVVASVPCALAVVDAEQAVILQKPRSLGSALLYSAPGEKKDSFALRLRMIFCPKPQKFPARPTALALNSPRPAARTRHLPCSNMEAAVDALRCGENKTVRTTPAAAQAPGGRRLGNAEEMHDSVRQPVTDTANQLWATARTIAAGMKRSSRQRLVEIRGPGRSECNVVDEPPHDQQAGGYT